DVGNLRRWSALDAHSREFATDEQNRLQSRRVEMNSQSRAWHSASATRCEASMARQGSYRNGRLRRRSSQTESRSRLRRSRGGTRGSACANWRGKGSCASLSLAFILDLKRRSPRFGNLLSAVPRGCKRFGHYLPNQHLTGLARMNVAGELVCRRCLQESGHAGLTSDRNRSGLKSAEHVGNNGALLRRSCRQRLVEGRDDSRLRGIRIIGGIVVHHNNASGESGCAQIAENGFHVRGDREKTRLNARWI